MLPVVIGVDVGTGAARSLAIDRDGQVLARAEAAYAGSESWSPGHADPGAWREAAAAAVDAVVAQLPSGARPVAIAVGGQSPTTVASGQQTAITVSHHAGIDLDPVAQHQAQRAVLDAESGQPIRPRQLWDWVLEQLGAEAAQGRWPGDPPLDGYGAVRRTGDVVGIADRRAGAGAGIPLVTGAQDAYLAFWAAGVDVPGRALDPGGRTGGLAVGAVEGVRVGGLWTMASAAQGVDIVGGPVSAHGIALEWLARLTGQPVPVLLELAESVPPGAAGVLMLPYLNGERAPRWNAALRGEIVGFDERAGVAELTRAVLEGTAYGLGHIAAVLRDANVHIETMVCAGTPARSLLWCEIKAAVLEVPVEVPLDVDLAAYGAALAAGAGVDWWPKPAAGRSGDWPRPPMRRIAPAPCAQYREGLLRFIELGDQAAGRVAG
jgi:sugar (pentulose or hexulose) kinase